MSDSLRSHGLQPIGLLHPWDFPGKSTGVGCHCLLLSMTLLGSKITADSDCNHEVRRRLLLGRKARTNLDSVLKSRHITLPTKVRTIKKVKPQRIDAFELWCWRRLLRVPWTARRLNRSISREINPEYLLEGLMPKLKLQYLVIRCEQLTHWTSL